MSPPLYACHVRAIRQQQRKTLHTVAQAAGISVSFLSAGERQLRHFNWMHQILLARALGVEPHDLVTFAEDSPPCTCAQAPEKGAA